MFLGHPVFKLSSFAIEFVFLFHPSDVLAVGTATVLCGEGLKDLLFFSTFFRLWLQQHRPGCFSSRQN